MAEALFSFRRIAKSLRRVADILDSGDTESIHISMDQTNGVDPVTGVTMVGGTTITIKIHMDNDIKPTTKELINKAMR